MDGISPTLAEWGCSLAIGAICTTPAVAPLLLWKGIASQILMNGAIRSICLITNRPQDNWLTALVFAFGSLHNLQIVIHEVGHAWTAMCLLQNPRPQITFMPYLHGNTSFYITTPTRLGNWLGIKNIQPLIGIAGPGFALAISSVQLWWGLKQKAASPDLNGLAKPLICAAGINFAAHARYAFSALRQRSNRLDHDFVLLKSVGLNPLIAGIAILAIPCLLIAQALWQTPAHSKPAPPALLPCHT